MCRFLIRDCKVDVNTTDAGGATPLIFAVQGVGSIDAINLLLEHKATDNDGISPLHIAAERGLANCVKSLLEAGADADAICPIENGELPVEIAALYGSKECVQILFPMTTPKADPAWSIDEIILHAKRVNDMYLGLAGEVLPCVVIVEESKTGAYYSGSVIFKSKVDTYIVTQSTEGQSDGDLLVSFHDKSRFPARIVLKDETFALLKLGRVHEDCKAIKFKDPTVVCNSFTLIPKDPRDMDSLSLFEKIPGFMHQPEWYAARGDAPINTIPDTKNYFLNLCHHGSTSKMISCPVFNMDGDCLGLVVGDCKHVAGHDDIPHKICLKGTCVLKMLSKIWKADIEEETAKQDNKRKRCPDPEQPGTRRGKIRAQDK